MVNLEAENIIQLRNIKFRWEGQENCLLDISDLAIKHGEKVFVKGASGSGKSSLLSLLSGIATPEHGEIEILGSVINQMNPNNRDQYRANHIGYIFQQFNLVPYLSVIENITLPCHFSKSRKEAVLAQSSSLRKEAERLIGELGLNHSDFLNKPVTQLSVGEQQRVAACRALIGSPEIILADEPTSSLDEGTQQAFINLLLKECQRYNTTLLFVSHDSRHSALFERSIELTKGNSQIEEKERIGGGVCVS